MIRHALPGRVSPRQSRIVTSQQIEPLEPRRLFAVSLSGATNVGSLIGRHTVADSLSSTNTADNRKLTMSAAGTLKIDLAGLSQNADVQLIRDANNNNLIDTGETLATSAKTGTAAEQIVKSLAAGTYFVRVYKTGTTSTNYALTLKSEYAGNTLAAARNIGALTAAKAFKDYIGSDDTADFYKFTLAGTKPFTASLSGLSADANVQIIRDANNNGLIDVGETIGQSAKTGTAGDKITKPLPAGTYFVRVYRGSGDTNYTLNLTPLGNLKIEFNYAYDTGGFFTKNPAAKDRLRDAAAAFEIFSDQLTAMRPGGTSGRWSLNFDHPSNPQENVVLYDQTIAANTLRIYVGAGGIIPANQLAWTERPGTGAGGTNAYITGITSRGQRGADPFDSSWPSDFAMWGGAISFRATTPWNFSSAAPSATQYDFYTVALQQLARIFGVNTSEVWSERLQFSPPAFTGANAKTANGGVLAPLSPDLQSLKQGLRSTVDGKAQNVLLHVLPKGVRWQMTRLDFAMMADLGWQVPGSAATANASADKLPYVPPSSPFVFAAAPSKRDLLDELA